MHGALNELEVLLWLIEEVGMDDECGWYGFKGNGREQSSRSMEVLVSASRPFTIITPAVGVTTS